MYDQNLGRALGYGQSFVPGRLGRRVRPKGVDVQTPQTPQLPPQPQPLPTAPPVAGPAPQIQGLTQRGGPMRKMLGRAKQKMSPLQRAIQPMQGQV